MNATNVFQYMTAYFSTWARPVSSVKDRKECKELRLADPPRFAQQEELTLANEWLRWRSELFENELRNASMRAERFLEYRHP